ncbi:MAG TPA: shikimate dehydrogenase [Bacillota bacterium]|nr:shikimate dehydrogenase [Bacillota bacterium]
MSGITGKTQVLGIFGSPVEHSFSPAMHNAAFASLGLDFLYAAFHVRPENLDRAVDSIRVLGMRGVNITIPHKQAVMPWLDSIHPSAQIIGAVNTIVNDDGQLTGYNTDGLGFVRSLREEMGTEVKGLKVAILGSGGAARGVGVELALAGADTIFLFNRNPEKAQELAAVIAGHSQAKSVVLPWTAAGLEQLPRELLLINSTPMGMYPNTDTIPPLVEDYLRNSWLVADLVYNPLETRLLQTAQAKGCQTLSGLGMLLYQGAIAFELWTGCPAPLKVMDAILKKSIEK